MSTSEAFIGGAEALDFVIREKKRKKKRKI